MQYFWKVRPASVNWLWHAHSRNISNVKTAILTGMRAECADRAACINR